MSGKAVPEGKLRGCCWGRGFVCGLVCVCVCLCLKLPKKKKSFISGSFVFAHVGERDVSLNNTCEFVRISQGTEVRRGTYCNAILLIR